MATQPLRRTPFDGATFFDAFQYPDGPLAGNGSWLPSDFQDNDAVVSGHGIFGVANHAAGAKSPTINGVFDLRNPFSIRATYRRASRVFFGDMAYVSLGYATGGYTALHVHGPDNTQPADGLLIRLESDIGNQTPFVKARVPLTDDFVVQWDFFDLTATLTLNGHLLQRRIVAGYDLETYADLVLLIYTDSGVPNLQLRELLMVGSN